MLNVRPHPDAVVENSSLAAMMPPEPTYELALPPPVISLNRSSSAQIHRMACTLRAIRPLRLRWSQGACPRSSSRRWCTRACGTSGDFPTATGRAFSLATGHDAFKVVCSSLTAPRANNETLIPISAGMGKGRELAGLIFENTLRGRRKHVWISTSTGAHPN